MKEGRICDNCGHHNTLGSLFCENTDCGEDISHLPPTKLEETDTASDRNSGEVQTASSPSECQKAKTIRMTGIRLVNTASGFEIPIPLEGGILGRSGTIQPEHFQNSQFVSNEHARIQLSPNGYVVVDLGSTNGTKINGMKIVSGKENPIPVGARISVANLDYVVHEM